MAVSNQFIHMYSILMYLWDYFAVTMTNYAHQSCIAFGYKQVRARKMLIQSSA